MNFKPFINACRNPLCTEILKPRAAAIGIFAFGAAQVCGSMFLGIGIPCMFHLTTGLPCPGCGLTRSVMSLLRGHVSESILFHPFGPLLLAALILALILTIMPGTRRDRFLDRLATLEAKTAAPAILLAIFMLIWGLRITHVLPLANLSQ